MDRLFYYAVSVDELQQLYNFRILQTEGSNLTGLCFRLLIQALNTFKQRQLLWQKDYNIQKLIPIRTANTDERFSFTFLFQYSWFKSNRHKQESNVKE